MFLNISYISRCSINSLIFYGRLFFSVKTLSVRLLKSNSAQFYHVSKSLIILSFLYSCSALVSLELKWKFHWKRTTHQRRYLDFTSWIPEDQKQYNMDFSVSQKSIFILNEIHSMLLYYNMTKLPKLQSSL